jgi:hypothetical protein
MRVKEFGDFGGDETRRGEKVDFGLPAVGFAVFEKHPVRSLH